MPTPKPPFFTWIDAVYASPDDVPERLRLEMKFLSALGASNEELSTIFNMPVEWVEEFARGAPRTKH